MSESRDPSADQSAAASPVRPQRTLTRRAVVVGGIAAGAVTVLGGAAYLAYTVTPKERFYPRPPILTYTGHGLARDAAWSPDGTRVASTGVEGIDPRAVHVWDATTGKRLLLCTLEEAAPDLFPKGVVWSADGGRLLAIVEGPFIAALDGFALDRVQEWDAATGQRVRSIPVRRTATVWAMNDRYLAVATRVAPQQAAAQRGALMGALIPATPAPPATPTQPPTPTPSATLTPPATLTPALPTPIPSPRYIIEVWELATGRLVATLHPDVPSAYSSIENLVWAPESSTLAVSTLAIGPGQTSNAWQIWDAPAGKRIQTIGIPSGDYEVLAWSRDGMSLALGGGVTDVATGRRTASYRPEGFLLAQAWAPDGRRIAVWFRTGTGLYSTKYDVIAVIEASSGRQIAIYNGGVSETPVESFPGPSPMAWSPDGKHLLVVRSGEVEVWQVGQG
jgi:WD40 repeat protein